MSYKYRRVPAQERPATVDATEVHSHEARVLTRANGHCVSEVAAR